MNICIAGKNNISVEILCYLIEQGIPKENICVIPNQTDNGKDNWQRSLLKQAANLNIKITSLEEIYNIENLLFLSLEFDKIIKPSKFNTNKLYNIHFSLLPKYKGMFTSIMPILYNEQFTGVTFHEIDNGIDTGNVIDQIKFSIENTDNSRDLYLKYTKNGVVLVKKSIDKILSNIYLERKKQNELVSSYYSKKTIDFSNILIDLNQTAINIHNQIRAFNFREYQVPKVFDTHIMSSKIINSNSSSKTGTILFENDICFVISTIDNDIVMYKDKVEELFKACENGSSELINRLVQIPKIINIQNQYGWTPLMVAIYNNHKEIVKTLLMNGCDLEITNFKGTTALMYAKSAFIIHKDRSIIDILLNFGVDIYQKDYQHKSVIEYCMENNEIEVLKIIENKGNK